MKACIQTHKLVCDNGPLVVCLCDCDRAPLSRGQFSQYQINIVSLSDLKFFRGEEAAICRDAGYIELIFGREIWQKPLLRYFGRLTTLFVGAEISPSIGGRHVDSVWADGDEQEEAGVESAHMERIFIGVNELDIGRACAHTTHKFFADCAALKQ